jgi:hypothetical protein
MASVQLLEKATYHRKIMNPSCDRFLSAARDSELFTSVLVFLARAGGIPISKRRGWPKGEPCANGWLGRQACPVYQRVRYTELAPDRFKDFWR